MEKEGGGKAAGSGGDTRLCDGIWATMCRSPFCTCGQRLARVVISVFMSRNELNAAVCVSKASAVGFWLYYHLAVFSLHLSVSPYRVITVSVFMSRNELKAAVRVSKASAVAFWLHCHLAVFSLHPSVSPYGP